MQWLSSHLTFYPLWLAIASLVVLGLEWAWPWRAQRRLRPRLASDLAFLAWNGHLLGVLLYALFRHVLTPILVAAHLYDGLSIASRWPLLAQVLVALVILDLVQWGTHRLLHRVPWLWTFHQVHHSVLDGEMDFLVSFRFHWMEAIVYKVVQYLPLLLLGFSTTAVFIVAVLGTLVGHLNHANLDLSWGPLRYVLNSPRMHVWHHDRDVEDGAVKNFGIVFSTWDWLAGTAYMPSRSPRALGYAGDDAMPSTFVARLLWPLTRTRA